MTDNSIDDLFTAKHARLTRMAILTNIVSWIVFISFTAYGAILFVQGWNSYAAQFPPLLDKHDPLAVAHLLLSFLTTFLQGVVSGMVLKGISLGLYMIVETDLNYREKTQEGNDEQQPL